MALAVAVAALPVLWAGPARAGTPIQIGQVSPGSPTVFCDLSNLIQASVGGPPSYTVPSDGVITGWSHRAHAGGGSGRLQVWRPAGGSNYTLVGRSDDETFDPGKINTFATNIPVRTGDVLGFRVTTAVGTGCGFDGGVGDAFRREQPGDDAAPGETRDMSIETTGSRVNVSATLDPTDPPPGDPAGLDSSKTKDKQKADKLKIKLTVDQDSTLDVGGKGKVPKREFASAAAKAKFKLKKKTGIGLQAGVTKTIKMKFKKNSKTLKRIKKLQKRSKKARKRSKVIVELALTTTAGVASDSKLKIKLKP